MSPQEMQNQLLNQRASSFAQLTPDQQLGQMAYKAGSSVGTGLAGAFGVDVQDPMIKRATKLRELAGQFNTNTAEGLRQMAQALQTTDPDMALQISQKAAEMDLAGAKLTSEKALGEQRGREKLAADPLEKILQTGKYEPKSVAAYKKSGNIEDLILVDKADPTTLSETSEGIFLINKLTGKVIKRIGSPVDRRASVHINTQGESEFVKQLGKNDATIVTKGYEVRDAAIEQLTSLKKMAEVVQRPVISGSFAEQRTDVANFFNTIGLSSNKDKIKTANSQEYIKYSTGLVLDNLRKTGYNPSNADMKVVQSLIPRLETDPVARQELIKFMTGKANDVIKEVNNREAYARKNRGLSGYTPEIPQVTLGSSSGSAKPYADLSDAELEAKIKAAQAKQ